MLAWIFRVATFPKVVHLPNACCIFPIGPRFCPPGETALPLDLLRAGDYNSVPSPTPPPLLSPILRTTRASHLQPPLFLNHKDPGRKPPTRLGAKPALCSTLPQFTFPCADLRCKQSSPALPATSWSNQIQRGRKEAEIHHPVKNRPSSLSPLPLTLSCYPGHVWIPQRSSPPGLRFPYKMVSHSSDSHLTLPPAHPLPLINET